LSAAGRTTDQVSGAFGAEGRSGCRCANFRHHGQPRNASPNLGARSSPHRVPSLGRSWPTSQGTSRARSTPRRAFSAGSRAQRVTDSRAACARRTAAEHRTGSFHLLNRWTVDIPSCGIRLCFATARLEVFAAGRQAGLS
jgi:hypothetical protein